MHRETFELTLIDLFIGYFKGAPFSLGSAQAIGSVSGPSGSHQILPNEFLSISIGINIRANKKSFWRVECPRSIFSTRRSRRDVVIR